MSIGGDPEKFGVRVELTSGREGWGGGCDERETSPPMAPSTSQPGRIGTTRRRREDMGHG